MNVRTVLSAAAAPAVLLACLALGGASCRRAAPPRRAAAPPPDATLHHPESALWDSAGGVWIVSNVNGSPLARDGNGFLSRYDAQGRPLALHWVDSSRAGVTLDAPKGLGIKGDTLFVADLDVVRMFRRTTGEPIGVRPVPGATFLNDIDVGPDGTVYVTDSGLKEGQGADARSGTDAVWRFGRDGRPEVVAKDTSLDEPNGVLAERGGVIVVTLGSGEVYRLDARGRRTNLPKPPTGALDGVVRLPDGSLLVSSWEGQAVYRLRGNTWTVAVDSVESPADIGYDSRAGILAIPQMMKDRLVLRPLR